MGMGTHDDPLGEVHVPMEHLVTMDGEQVEYIIDPPSHRSSEDAGCLKLQVSLATIRDRRMYRRESSGSSFFEPPSKELVRMYKEEVLNKDSSSVRTPKSSTMSFRSNRSYKSKSFSFDDR